MQNRGNALTRLNELERDAIVLLERLVETRLRKILQGMVGGFLGAGGAIILHSPGVLLLVSSSFLPAGVAAAAVAVTHDLPLTGGRLTSLSLFLLALADVVRNDDSLKRLRLLRLMMLLIICLLVIGVYRCVVDSQ